MFQNSLDLTSDELESYMPELLDGLWELNTCVKEDGYILLEFMFAEQVTEGMVTNVEMINIIEQTSYRILDRIDWNRETLKQTNRQNIEVIQENAKRLISLYSDKEEIFNEYLQNQIDECEELENEYICTTLLLGPKNLLKE